MTQIICDFFVYGTLKRGQCRDRCWPCEPTGIQEVRVRGCLYDLGPYPAMTPGPDWVCGEVWSFVPEDVATVLRALDQIEGYDQPGSSDLYLRTTVEWFNLSTDDVAGQAMTYHYAAASSLSAHQRMSPTKSGHVQWP